MGYGVTITPAVYSLTIAAGSTKTDPNNIIDFGNVVTFLQLHNMGSSTLKVYLNDLNQPFTLGAGETQVFNLGDLHITRVAFDNGTSGAADTVLEIIAGMSS